MIEYVVDNLKVKEIIQILSNANEGNKVLVIDENIISVYSKGEYADIVKRFSVI